MRLEHLLSGEDDYQSLIIIRTQENKKRFASNPCFFTADVYNIEKDEAERNAHSLKPVL